MSPNVVVSCGAIEIWSTRNSKCFLVLIHFFAVSFFPDPEALSVILLAFTWQLCRWDSSLTYAMVIIWNAQQKSRHDASRGCLICIRQCVTNFFAWHAYCICVRDVRYFFRVNECPRLGLVLNYLVYSLMSTGYLWPGLRLTFFSLMLAFTGRQINEHLQCKNKVPYSERHMTWWPFVSVHPRGVTMVQCRPTILIHHSIIGILISNLEAWSLFNELEEGD